MLRYYRGVKLSEAQQHRVSEGLRSELDRQREQAAPEIEWARRRVTELDSERRRLARAVVTGAVPADLAPGEQARITRELEGAQRVLATSELVYGQIEETLTLALELVGRIDEVYRLGNGRVRRLANQCFFNKLLVDDGQVTGVLMVEPWPDLLEVGAGSGPNQNKTNEGAAFAGLRSNEDFMVRPAGFEPATHGLGRRPGSGRETAFDQGGTARPDSIDRCSPRIRHRGPGGDRSGRVPLPGRRGGTPGGACYFCSTVMDPIAASRNAARPGARAARATGSRRRRARVTGRLRPCPCVSFGRRRATVQEPAVLARVGDAVSEAAQHGRAHREHRGDLRPRDAKQGGEQHHPRDDQEQKNGETRTSIDHTDMSLPRSPDSSGVGSVVVIRNAGLLGSWAQWATVMTMRRSAGGVGGGGPGSWGVSGRARRGGAAGSHVRHRWR